MSIKTMNDEKQIKSRKRRGVSIITKGGKRFRLTVIDEDKSDIRAADRARKEGDLMSWEEVKAELGL